MYAYKLAVKYFAANGSAVAQKDFVPIFHSWIQTRAVDGHQLIDVADYQHVESGPGIVLVAHEANFSTDASDGRLGLLYNRKQPWADEKEFASSLRTVFRDTLAACVRLEQALGNQLRFRTDDPVFRIHDRLLAPNEAATFSAVEGDLKTFLAELYGGDVKLQHSGDAKELFEVAISAPATEAATLLGRL